MIQLFILEDHPVIVSGLKHMFRHGREKIEVTGWCMDITKFISEVPEDRFNVIILDLWLPGTDPVDNLVRIQNRFPGKPVVIFTSETSIHWVKTMMEQGVKAYLMKDIEKKELKIVLEKVYSGKTVLPDLKVGQTVSFENNEFLFQKYFLKPSERMVLFNLSNGKSLKDIAALRFTTVSAVEKTVCNVRTRFGVKNNAELIRTLVEQKLL